MPTIYGTNSSETINGGAPFFTTGGDDLVYAYDGDDTIDPGFGSDTVYAGNGNDTIINHGYFTADKDNFYGEGGDDLFVVSGNAAMDGGIGNDTYQWSFESDFAVNLQTGAGPFGLSFVSIENVHTGDGNDMLIGNGVQNYLIGGGGNDIIAGGAGADVLMGGAGIDKVSYYNSGQGITVNINGTGQGGDAQGDTLTGFEILEGSALGDTLGGDVNDNQLYGLSGTDSLKGLGGADRLEGGAGADLLQGGPGSDLYIYDTDDVYDETTLGADGYDTVESSSSVDMSSPARFKGDFEALTLLGAGNIDGTGTAGANHITGNSGVNILTGGAGDDTLEGGAGGDSLRGGAGDDTYLVDGSLDRINESIAGSDGSDTVQAAFSFSLMNTTVLSGNIENLTLLGSEDINGVGNALNNVIFGNVGVNMLTGSVGNDFLSGGGGADTFRGGVGNDTYYIDGDDTVDESITGSAGIDTIQIAASLDIVPSTTLRGVIENLTLVGVGNFDGGGNALANVMIGNAGANTLNGLEGNDVLDGYLGADVLVGGAGNDTFYVSLAEDVVIEASGGGADRVFSEVAYVLEAGASIEALATRNAAGTSAIDLTGNDFAQTITGNAGSNILHGLGGNDTLNGGAGADTMYGEAGNDVYYVDSNSDKVREDVGGGQDTVFASNTFFLFSTAEIEVLCAVDPSSTAAIQLRGNGFNQTVRGNAGANILHGLGGSDVLDGGVGADTMYGGVDNDTYRVDNNGDKVVEAAGGGTTDWVAASVSYTLGAGVQVEKITTTSSGASTAIDLTGNEFVQSITGNAGNNRLNGGGGADTMIGLGGNDTYYVDNAGDKVIEGAGQGTADWVAASVSYTLGAGVQVERLSTTASGATTAIDLIGNQFVQVMTGNAGANRLNGMAGADTMTGLGGNDTYYIDNAGDKVTEGAGQGTADWVATGISYTLAAGVQVEKLSTTISGGTTAINLTGNEFIQTITGNAGANVLIGRGGNDTLTGAGGADIFFFDSALGSANIDRITDYNVAADTIRLENAIFTAIVGTGTLTAGQFVSDATGVAHDANDRIIYETDTGKLLYDANGGAAGGAIQFATITANLSLTIADFAVV